MAEALLTPQQPPSDSHAVIVVLESAQLPVPLLDTAPLTHETLVYRRTTGRDDVAARIKDASVVVITICPLTADTIAQAPHLKAIVAHTAGVDHIDLEACKKRGIKVYNSPGCAAQTVAEHAIALYFSLRRCLFPLHMGMLDFGKDRPNMWKEKGTMASVMLNGEGGSPKTCSQEVVGIIGYGNIGKRIATACRALGMRVIVADRKGSAPLGPDPQVVGGEKVISFDKVLRTATAIVVAVPFTVSTDNLIADEELSAMRPDAIIINISRGSIVNERSVLVALRDRRVFGYAADVFETEPAGSGEDCVLLSDDAKGLNLALTPHLAWCSDLTKENLLEMVRVNIRHWADGQDGTVGV